MLQKIISLIFLLFFSSVAYSFEIGVSTHFTRYKKDSSLYLSSLESYGFSSYRDGFSWASLEISPGDLRISKNNKSLDDLFLNDLSTPTKNSMFVLGYGNENFTDSGYPKNKEQVDKFVDYVAWVVSRYKGRIKYYEIWNEWLLATGLPNKKGRPSDDIFMYLVEQSAKKIKSIDPDAIVLTGSVNPISHREEEWILKLARSGLTSYVDGISIHPYSFLARDRGLRNPINNILKIDDFERKLSVAAGYQVPIYITEMGFPVSLYVAGGVESKTAADYIFKYTVLAKSRSYIKGIWWYDLVDDGDNPFNKEHNFGLFKANNEPKDSARTLKEIIPFLLKDNLFFEYKDGKVNVYALSKKNTRSLKLSWDVNPEFTVDKFYNDMSSLRLN